MFEQIAGGCSHVIKEGTPLPSLPVYTRVRTHVCSRTGDQKDKMWQLMCCASELHQTNVNTINTLTQTNNMLQEKNRELEDLAQKQQGFGSSSSARLEKRARVDEGPPVGSTGAAHATVSDLENGGPSDLWASFARSFSQENARSRY
jgi:hypothetical protein